jgi:hypothetical protein
MWFGKLERKKSKVADLNPGGEGGAKSSSTSKSFLSMTNQFSRLNPMTKLKLSVRKSNASGESKSRGWGGKMAPKATAILSLF